jgi:DNA helicase HerA-like ATPase
MANRHGLIAGATGTGKTVTLQILAEAFSRQGVPVFMADVKGDLSGLGAAGSLDPKITARVEHIGIPGFAFDCNPVEFWDVFGDQGLPIRTTITDMGPLLLSRLLGLNETQEGILTVVFRIADQEGWLLLDLKDLRAALQYAADNARALRATHGNVSAASVGAIQRRLLSLEDQGAERFFGEPALALSDFMRIDPKGRGVINILTADRLMLAPALYAALLLWLLSELFELLPESGDRDRPKLVLFFDEAHLLFDDVPVALLAKVEQVVRLIRSKGVGIYFVTQNPLDIPLPILGQLGNRVQHALRAFTPRDQKAVRTAAETFRPNPDFDTSEAITTLGVGEALVSTLDRDGRPEPVERVLVRPPESRIGPLNPGERAAVVRASPLRLVYEKTVDRDSAYEILARRAQAVSQEASREIEVASAKTRRRGDSPLQALMKSAARSVGHHLGRQLIRGILGALQGGR